MALPLSYSLRNVTVRRASALLTALGIAMTVAVFAGVFSLHNGFKQIYKPLGREDIGIYLRQGARSEGESGLTQDQVRIIKTRPEVARDDSGAPLAAAEMFLAVYMEKSGGGLTNVPLRGIEPMTLQIHENDLVIEDGRWPNFDANEVVVGAPLTRRMKDCKLGDKLMLNVTEFEVVGVYRHDGALGSEVWGGVERMMQALERPVFQRVAARMKPETDFEAVATELSQDARTPAGFFSEREYLTMQAGALGNALFYVGIGLTVIMSFAAVLGAVNTMLASIGSRTHEIGVLLAIGYPRFSIFLAFLFESMIIGVIGGILGLFILVPVNGIETGAMNWDTFTDVTFAFRMSPALVAVSVGVAILLGLIGGALPALRASLMKPVDAIRA